MRAIGGGSSALCLAKSTATALVDMIQIEELSWQENPSIVHVT